MHINLGGQHYVNIEYSSIKETGRGINLMEAETNSKKSLYFSNLLDKFKNQDEHSMSPGA